MRAAVIARLLGTPAVTAIAGQRVYGRQGPYGGVSKEATPEAFTADGDLLPSVVVWLEGRANGAERDRQGRDTLTARQTIAVGLLEQEGYGHVGQLRRAVKAALHQAQPRLEALEEDGIKWADTAWAEDSPELIDPALEVPILIVRFVAVITEQLT